MRFLTEADTDYGGLVLFAPDRLRAHHGGVIAEGTNLLELYLASDEGDRVLAEGLIVPILAIDTGGYRISVRDADEQTAFPAPWERCAHNAAYYLQVVGRLCLADVVVLREWHDELAWQEVPAQPGHYRVSIDGFRYIAPGRYGDELRGAGYEITLARTNGLVAVSADTGRDMRVLRRPDDAS